MEHIAGTVELRQDEGGRKRIRGRFPYKSTATMRDRGKVRKERFEPHSLSYAIEDETRPIHILVGHSYDRPIAVRAAAGSGVTSTAKVVDTDEGVEFETDELPEDLDDLPSYYRDLLWNITQGLMIGVSPGFTVAPLDVVPGAEQLLPEPGNPDVLIRSIRAAVLHELSIVTRPAYRESVVDLRSMDARRYAPRRRVWL